MIVLHHINQHVYQHLFFVFCFCCFVAVVANAAVAVVVVAVVVVAAIAFVQKDIVHLALGADKCTIKNNAPPVMTICSCFAHPK